MSFKTFLHKIRTNKIKLLFSSCHMRYIIGKTQFLIYVFMQDWIIGFLVFFICHYFSRMQITKHVNLKICVYIFLARFLLFCFIYVFAWKNCFDNSEFCCCCMEYMKWLYLWYPSCRIFKYAWSYGTEVTNTSLYYTFYFLIFCTILWFGKYLYVSYCFIFYFLFKLCQCFFSCFIFAFVDLKYLYSLFFQFYHGINRLIAVEITKTGVRTIFLVMMVLGKRWQL